MGLQELEGSWRELLERGYLALVRRLIHDQLWARSGELAMAVESWANLWKEHYRYKSAWRRTMLAVTAFEDLAKHMHIDMGCDAQVRIEESEQK